MTVGVWVWVGDGVADGGVPVTVGVLVFVGVAVWVGVRVTVGVKVIVGVRVTVGVKVTVGVIVMVGVSVTVGVTVVVVVICAKAESDQPPGSELIGSELTALRASCPDDWWLIISGV